MTEYWVSQGNKWCDFCKIYIANNPLSIRTHELGQRHKDSVAKRLASMRKESAAKEKEQKEAARALEQIEAVCQIGTIENLLGVGVRCKITAKEKNGDSPEEGDPLTQIFSLFFYLAAALCDFYMIDPRKLSGAIKRTWQLSGMLGIQMHLPQKLVEKFLMHQAMEILEPNTSK